MLNVSKDIENDKKKNKPNIVAPIINTVISAAAIVGIIIMKVLSSEFSWGLFICLYKGTGRIRSKKASVYSI